MFYVERNFTAYLLLGSNMGDRKVLLESALDLIAREAGPVVLCSSLYETDPVGFESDDRFLNRVVGISTALSPEKLLETVLDIELRLGRVRTGGPQYDSRGERVYSSRPIDIDILLYEDLIIGTPDLQVPHPRMTQRAFTMLPLAEIAPDLRHPVSGRRMSAIAADLVAGHQAEGVTKLP